MANFGFVQKAWNSTAGTAPATTTLSLPNVGGGSLVVASVIFITTAVAFSLTSLTDGNGNNFIVTPNSPFQYNSAQRYIWLGYILSAKAGSMTITATPSVAHGMSIHAIEFSHTGVCNFDSDIGTFATTGTTPISTPTITPATVTELLYAATVPDPAGAGTLSGAVGGGWTVGTNGVIASDSNNSGDEYILSASSGTAVNWTVTGSSNTGWNAAGMSFSSTPSEVTDDSPPMMLIQQPNNLISTWC